MPEATREQLTAAGPLRVLARTVLLSVEADEATSQARYEKGVVTLVIAKKVIAGETLLSIA